MSPSRSETSAPPICTETVIFDVDGTLVDSAADIHAALNHGLALAGGGPVDFAAARRLIGLGLERSVEKVLADRGFALDGAELVRIKSACTAYYDAHLLERTRLYEGVAETLEALRNTGTRLGICTNKRAEATRRILSGLGILNHFGVIIARETVAQGKPHPAPLLAAIHALEGHYSRAAMVGDTLADMQCARAAGVTAIAVSYGYSDLPVSELGADTLVEVFSELFSALRA
jgi:phosphoglycolate phosphatase